MTKERLNPEWEANVLSRISFYWVQSIFTIGHKRPLTDDDIFPLDPRLQSERLTALLEQQWFREAEKTKKPSLLVTLLKRHLYTIIWVFFASVLEAVLRCTTPYFIARSSAYFDTPEDPKDAMSLNEVLMWSGLMFASHAIYVPFRNIMFYGILRFGTNIRVSVSGLVYRKACRITQSEMGDRSVGYILNLMTNDAQRLDEYIVPAYVICNLWAVLIVSFTIMYYELGIYATVAAFAGMFSFIPLQLLVGRVIGYLRKVTAPLTDQRIKIIHEIISFMKIIKMYGWELMFKDLVGKIRSQESNYIGLFVLMRLTNNMLVFISPIITLVVIMTVKHYVGEDITAPEILFFLSISGVLRIYLNIFLGHTFTFVPQVFHSLGRIQNFLNADEITHLENKAAIKNLTNEVIINKNFIHKDIADKEDKNGDDHQNQLSEGEALVMDKLHSSWGKGGFGLSGISLNLCDGELVAVIGPVACGKTTLLMTLIQELVPTEGMLAKSGTVGYASQVPWIYNGNIEDNIVFNRMYDKAKLNKCIETCYLTKDLEQLPHGIYTMVGERGVALSGGQRARVNLARAVYGGDPIILLDDPLSAVDSKCAKHIFHELIKGELCTKTRILVTHSTHFLPGVDRIVVMEADETHNKGKITHVGSYNELLKQGVNVSSFVADKTESKKRRTLSHLSSISKSLSNLEYLDESESDEEEVQVKERPKEVTEEKTSGTLDRRLYARFLSLGLGYIALPFLVVAMIAPQVGDLYQQDYLLSWRTSIVRTTLTPQELVDYNTRSYYIYIGLAFGAIAMFTCRSLFYIYLINRSGMKLHDRALYAILRSPIRFFDTHPVGIILNRFSKDTYYMDELFPDVFMEFLTLSILYIGTIILVVAANYWFGLAVIPLALLMLYTIRYYLATSIEIRRIEAINRSPVLSHIAATLSGLTTIRANDQIDIYEAKYYKLRDAHTKCWMLLRATASWLSIRLDFVAILIIIIATLACIFLKDVVGESLAGLAIVYVNSIIGGFQWCVRQSVESESLMTAIERIFDFAALPPEAALETHKTLKTKYTVQNEIIANKAASDADNEGIIEFVNVRLKYGPELNYVLNDLSFITQPKEKIGIVGRTGAGKSTILQALFRMVEPEGDILLDGVLTRDMGLHELRTYISVIPQESLLFSETLRVNLDPFNEFLDEKLWNALEKVELKSYFSAQKDKLEMQIQEGGSNLSAGQRQLLCLARALLRDNKILVIDEATANVDEKTDQLIQQTLRVKFADCTVLTIAHRIHTIIDCDRIMVMEAGELAEFDHPAILLRDPDSLFSSLVNETGISNLLRELAEKSYQLKVERELKEFDSVDLI